VPDGTIQTAAAQTGDSLRTAKKNFGASDVHEEYIVPDVPWTVWGSYSWCTYIAGTTGAGDTGALAALLRLPGASNRDIAIRAIAVGFINDGAGNANFISVTRSTQLPGANTRDPIANIMKKQTVDRVGVAIPAPTGITYVKPSGITGLLSSAGNGLLAKSNVLNALDYKVFRYDEDIEPFLLEAGEAAVVYQAVAGTATEHLIVGFEWQEITQ
jgi:hypothetical protein